MVVARSAACESFVVDTSGGLEISRAFVDGVEVPIALGVPHAVLGVAASVALPARAAPGVHRPRFVRLEYSTGARCSAAQWLENEQTADKKRPYLFTQCQAIHARSLIPCQDAPGAKLTWDVRSRRVFSNFGRRRRRRTKRCPKKKTLGRKETREKRFNY